MKLKRINMNYVMRLSMKKRILVSILQGIEINSPEVLRTKAQEEDSSRVRVHKTRAQEAEAHKDSFQEVDSLRVRAHQTKAQGVVDFLVRVSKTEDPNREAADQEAVANVQGLTLASRVFLTCHLRRMEDLLLLRENSYQRRLKTSREVKQASSSQKEPTMTWQIDMLRRVFQGEVT
jgi:hypothetical protein